MEKMIFKGYLAQSQAAILGRVEYGDFSITPTPEQFAALTEQERLFLVSPKGRFDFDCVDTTWDAMVTRMRERLAEVIAEQTKKEAAHNAFQQELERYVLHAVAQPDSAWIEDGGWEVRVKTPWPEGVTYSVSHKAEDDARIVERRKHVRSTICEPTNAQRKADRESENEAREKAAEEKAKLQKQHTEAQSKRLTEWLSRTGDESDRMAIAKGYAMTARAIVEIETAFETGYPECETFTCSLDGFKCSVRNSPNGIALAKADDIEKHVEHVRLALPDFVDVSVSKILRLEDGDVNLCDGGEDDDNTKIINPVTALIVTATCALFTRSFVYSLEE